MRAAFYTSPGPASDVLQLGNVRMPTAETGEVRVKLAWSGVNPSDVKSRAGLRSKTLPFPQIIPHSDGMGVIDEVGEGVDASRIGERVWVWNGAWGRASGTAAQWIAVPSSQAVPLPGNVDDAAGACMGIPAMTAMHALAMDGGVAGKTVLVAGGAGAVGHYALQFASRLGAARIITTVSSPEKAELAKRAGADDAINYRDEPVAQRVMELTGGKGVDRIIEVDLAANAELDLQVLRPGAECVVYGSGSAMMNLPFFPLIAKNIQLKFFMVYHLSHEDRARAQSALTRMLAKGGIQHNIAARLALDQVVQAHELVESGKAVGNVVLEIPQG